MSRLKNIREKFGVSQQDAAHWLGISRSLVALYERGIRSLPTHALLQLGKLEMLVVEFEKSSSLDRNHGDGTDQVGTSTKVKVVRGDTNHGVNDGEGTNHGSGYTEYSEPMKPLELLQPVPTHPKLAFQLTKAERLHQQLTIVQSKHAALQQQQLLIQKMMDNCDEYTSEKEKLWLQMLYHGLCCKISKFDESKQVALKGKILEMRIRGELAGRRTG